jgi:hypothetical protein
MIARQILPPQTVTHLRKRIMMDPFGAGVDQRNSVILLIALCVIRSRRLA